MNTLSSNFEKHIEQVISLIIEYTPRIIGAVLVLIIGLWLINRFTRITTNTMEKKQLDVSLRTFLKSLMSVGLKIILVVTVAGMLGIGTTSFVTILGAAGLAVGLALQGSLSNFAGGVLILILKPYKVGDKIEVSGQSGTVQEIQIFNTILLTGDLKTIILPNGSVSNGTIVNHTTYGILRSDIQVTVSAMNDVDKVKQSLMEAMMTHPHILKNPLPEVTVIKIIDNGVTLSLKPYCLSAHASNLNSEMVEITREVFEKNQILPALKATTIAG